ncbi:MULTISPECIES: RNA polymerase sigma factor [Sorangium]|uniref:RNA polymerase sigma factor n=1 Tax=Sorangium cellulosum TaxID=56 RepID=A0A4P2QVX1_SORCE|nr:MULTISPECIES: RNA polymerase sigma factor [Sorangium]AUX33753.1 RNA polymerase sigma factor [Sorangium cellulosum]WCQ93064.1 RNA polymerase sigma-H factor [Sorangium sp. Soce836]
MRTLALVMPFLFSRGAERAQDEEEALVERLRRGDAAAVGEAYDKHYAAVRGFARRLTGDDAAAEDLAHDVFVSLPQAAQRFRGGSSLKTFLIAIAVNHSRHHLRAAARRRAAMERLALEPDEGDAPSPEREAGRAALAQALSRALDALPDAQRATFVLCEVEERSAREVSEILGVPEATVRTRLFHAKQKLRTLLEERTP